ncbi:hypothetical protein B0H19DRAFT_871500, partial [Mycena capillaripes]
YAGFLHNSPHSVVYNNAEYPSLLHLHEAMKFLPNNPHLAERIRCCLGAREVYPLSDELTRLYPDAVRSDWPTLYLTSMEKAIWLKFRQHADLRDILVRTGDAPLIYADEEDAYWGEGSPGQGGMNHFGRILQYVRDELLGE